MQEQKINHIQYIAIQNTYEEIEVGLYNNDQLLGKINIHKNEASKTLLIHIEILLTLHSLKINNLSFIGVNKGPGPFTTLRTVIASVNALNFATHIPLIGVDGLYAFISEYQDTNWPVTVVMLNAFNNDVYYAIKHDDQIETGAKNINVLLQELKSNQKIRFMGNGTKLFETQIKETFGDLAYIPEPNPNTCSIDSVAKLAYQKWLKKEIQEQILPLYLKDAIKK
ncbi:MAG: tRNA (adenosine(37)-N6)-threonylcarbamoyltransferase complex dimerization subunit type 1 TsaB [Candidatus Babeliales bacterium]|nr:tRNA (adenosine(37)-N6)-threonylcarbamoyltransferase complex dimerization subunit type 1 TsaB [Candidatus Babeliales bacterium]